MTQNNIYYHYIFDLYDCPHSLLNTVECGLQIIRKVCTNASLNLLHTFEKSYDHTNGYSCMGILSESHISVHTWPELSYCAVDVFICRGNIEVAEATILEEFQPKQFTKRIVNRSVCYKPEIEWVYSKVVNDYFEAYKCNESIAHKQSRYQQIDLFTNPSYGKILMLDGDIQISTKDEMLYHEYLVHPVLLAHPNPKSILILGGGDGGCLREVVKNKEFKKIVLVDIDKDVVETSRKYLAEVHQDSFEDPRVEVIFSDASDYLGKDKFDIIISDLTAPTGPSIKAYNVLAKKLYSSLNDSGYVAMHSGWWSSSVLKDFPSTMFEGLSNQLVYNLWIDSFACFWSFILGWNHSTPAESVLKRIDSNSNNIESTHFNSNDYLNNILIKPNYSND